MTKQSSEYNGAPLARHYLLDCRATLAMTRVLTVYKKHATTHMLESLSLRGMK